MTVPPVAPRRRARLALDVVSLLLLLAGLTGLVVVAFRVDRDAGWAVLSVYAALGGLFLGIDR